MIEFTCPVCSHHNALNHADIDYASGHGVEVSCSKCEAELDVNIEAVPDVWGVRRRGEKETR